MGLKIFTTFLTTPTINNAKRPRFIGGVLIILISCCLLAVVEEGYRPGRLVAVAYPDRLVLWLPF